MQFVTWFPEVIPAYLIAFLCLAFPKLATTSSNRGLLSSVRHIEICSKCSTKYRAKLFVL